jgi:hypothetical protein
METGKGFLSTILWGIAAGIGLRIGWGIVGWLLETALHAVNH